MLLLIMLHKNVSFLTIQRKWKDFFKFGDSYTSDYQNIGQKVYTNITEGKFQKKKLIKYINLGNFLGLR